MAAIVSDFTSPKTILEALGFYDYNRRGKDKDVLDNEFLALTGSLDTIIEHSKFEAHCLSLRFTPAQAQAFIKTFDFSLSSPLSGKTSGIDRYEYILFRSCTTHFDPERDNGTFLVDLRLTAVFHLYDSNSDNRLEINELKELIRDMCASDTHIQWVFEKLGISSQTQCSLEFFKSAPCLTLFNSLGLKTRYLLRSAHNLISEGVQHHAYPPRVQWRTRALEAVGDSLDDGLKPGVIPCASAPIKTEAVNPGIELEPGIISEVDMRGLLVNRSSEAFAIATAVIERCRQLSLATYNESDIGDPSWLRSGACLAKMLNCKPDNFSEIAKVVELLSRECERILRSQPMCVHEKCAVKVFGDIHGQFRDLLILFREFGFPSSRGDIETVKYIFNGDFVDRGFHQLEVVIFLFALKVAYPSRVFLIRGNHEFSEQNFHDTQTGFHLACRARLGSDFLSKQVFDRIHLTFGWLPLSAVIDDSVLILHGGIGDGSWSLSHLASIPRPLHALPDDAFGGPLLAKLVRDVLWSDPQEGDESMSRGVHGSPRGGGISTFSRDVTKEFCRRNGLQLIIRSHQFVSQGFKIMHGGQLATVFSARNYFQREKNDSAILMLARDDEMNLQVIPKKLHHHVDVLRSDDC